MNITSVLFLDDKLYNEDTLQEENLNLSSAEDFQICHKDDEEDFLSKAKAAFCKNCGQHKKNCKLFALNRGTERNSLLQSEEQQSIVSIWRVIS
ncbi:MAG: hypothetical protein PHE89_05420 [Alphaproteobacteria bacterium]|nr:hypothetical protein [Alphaproteobacteria bacterium]